MLFFFYRISMFMILISSKGLFVLSTFSLSMLCTTSIPAVTRPNTVCLLSNHVYNRVQHKYTIHHYKNEKTYRWCNCDKELTSICVWSCISHTNCIWTIMSILSRKFIFKIIAPNGFSTCTITKWTTCLNHKSLDNSMEYKIVIVSILCVRSKVLYSFRCSIRE